MTEEEAAAYDEALRKSVYGEDGHMHFWTQYRLRWFFWPTVSCRCGQRL